MLKKISRIVFVLTKMANGEDVAKSDDKNASEINSWMKTTFDGLVRDIGSWAVRH